MYNDNDTIIAPATPTGGALCVIRLSGERAIELCDEVFEGRKRLAESKTATAHYGLIKDEGQVVDDVVVTLYRAPHSYTGENSVEISAHGSRYVVGRILSLLLSRGARLAEAGEFTRRAFLAGRMDLSQAEAVADVIAADSRASHAVASTQMRGAYSEELAALRSKLLHITSLLELELDFSEEDVEFADRKELAQLLDVVRDRVESLQSSFRLGNVLKEGVTVAIAGRPNVGKSTLLNRLVGEDRAMVSDIAGTTRDTVEAVANIDGVMFRFVDTAGLHSTDDVLEQMGIERTAQALKKARIVLWITDNANFEEKDIMREFGDFRPSDEQAIYRVVNKIDLFGSGDCATGEHDLNMPMSATDIGRGAIRVSAKTGKGVEALVEVLKSAVDVSAAYAGDVIVSNQRHYEALTQAREALDASLLAMRKGLPSDLLSEEIRQVLYHLGSITGEISSEDILQNIFSRFCIGK
ncbi:MAG: tRNA uridine-5-carboxymethylaminomethyl(34) synthesis GTPase MnmE [Alistipes sp.]|nr:tRNA uridine-5-carboxymethylaminomethyl(34) synthesis GTPase MnmE [Alistipes sp.]